MTLAPACVLLGGLLHATAAGPQPRAATGMDSIRADARDGGAPSARSSQEDLVASADQVAMLPTLLRPEDLAAALPAPPEKVVLDPGYFGAVTLDHRAHLARRATCKACHGPGPVAKLGRIPPARAHQACRGCHQELARGPTQCRDCHLVKPSPSETAIAAAALEGQSTSGDGSPSTAANVPAPLAAQQVATPAPDGPPEHLALRRTIHAGMSVVSATGRAPAAGYTAGLTFRQDGFALSQTFEWSGGGSRSRTTGLLGGGIVFPVSPRLTGELLGVGGFDLANGVPANLVPTAGVRACLEWAGGRSWVRSLQLSITGMMDLTPHREGAEPGTRGFVLSAGLAAGIEAAGSVRTGRDPSK